MNRITRATYFAAAILLLLLGAASAQDEDRTIKAGEEGTTLDAMTVEGEDKISIEFERPKLALDIDPLSAPGLEWDVVWSLLGAASLDLYRPLSERSEHLRANYRARPWLDEFRAGDVARFRTSIQGASGWSMTIVDSRGETVRKFSGEKNPPEEIAWDGLATSGDPALPGLRYSFVLEAADRAGNKRRFVGDGFEVPPYRLESTTGLTMCFAGASSTPVEGIPAPVLLEAASRINQYRADASVTVTVTGPDYKSANARAEAIAKDLRPMLLGDPARVRTVAEVQKGTPEAGSAAVAVSVAGK